AHRHRTAPGRFTPSPACVAARSAADARRRAGGVCPQRAAAAFAARRQPGAGPYGAPFAGPGTVQAAESRAARRLGHLPGRHTPAGERPGWPGLGSRITVRETRPALPGGGILPAGLVGT